jgi:hypothetical protein
MEVDSFGSDEDFIREHYQAMHKEALESRSSVISDGR